MGHANSVCNSCGKPVRRASLPGAPWEMVFAVGDRVLGTHPMDAVGGRLYTGTATSTRDHRMADGTIVPMVTVEFDETDLLPSRSAELVASTLTPNSPAG